MVDKMKKLSLIFLLTASLAACQQRTVTESTVYDDPNDDAVYDEYGQLVSVHQTSTAATTNADPDRIVLTDYTQEEQIRDRTDYANQMDEVEASRVVIDNVDIPTISSVNVAAYARSTTNQVGVQVYSRSGNRGRCGSYGSSDAAQRAFLEQGGPNVDPLGLDPDGDGFACAFNPNIYRALM